MATAKLVSSTLLVLVTAVACKRSTPNPTANSSAATTSSAAAAASTEELPIAPATTEAEQRELAQRVVTLLDQGKVAIVRKLFDDAMNKALASDEAVTRLWDGVEREYGQLEKQIATKVERRPPYSVALVTCRFAKSPMDVLVVFDDAGRLAGLQVTLSQTPEAYGERPQTPKPPFPYAQREVLYDNPADGINIGGTLTVPEGEGPHPAVLLITGSGPQDRDETLNGHKPFWVIADHLSRKGIAVLRVDDRGVGKTTGDPSKATVEMHATDAEAGIAFLKKQKEIDPKRIGLIGHSEGGMIAPMVAAKSPDVAFIVSLAGPGVSGAELNPVQVDALLRAQKHPESVIAEIVDGQKKLMKLIVTDAPEDKLRAAVKELATVTVKLGNNANPDDLDIKKAAARDILRLLSPWFRSYAKVEPAKHWAKVRVPTLLMIGDRERMRRLCKQFFPMGQEQQSRMTAKLLA
jgi:pimeloyl-ACP methyl ester carboxylesterase